LPGSAWWALWGMEPLCLARTPENTWFLPCTCRREPPANVTKLLFLKKVGAC
jgi:hypothetical protein